jgi:hypothetical protein
VSRVYWNFAARRFLRRGIQFIERGHVSIPVFQSRSIYGTGVTEAMAQNQKALLT